MSTFVIFWAALLAVILFIFDTFFKVLASACNALFSSLKLIFISVTVAGVTVVVLTLLGSMSDSVTGGNWMWMIPLAVIAAGILGTISYGLGASIYELVSDLVSLAMEHVLIAFEKAADVCEKGYNKLLTIIIKQVEKC